ncbi:uncharacterized protein LOC125258385 [Megalobrama amblycephala]|uniref:uncharacterized protein LOC125258385 n=1 Tax=Megalobrama amblycephala TaxID=75352 RepID=UPI00201400B2|nr:uncharacterized protein LOC125258385 [Megalobrama amblycephala]
MTTYGGPSSSGSAGPRNNIVSASLDLGESGRPFVLAQQLRDSCRKWLLAEGSDVDLVIDRVVLEQIITRLPKKTAEWVQCHRPTSLDSAIQLAEDHMVACQGGGEPFQLSLSLPLFCPPLSLDLSLFPGLVRPAHLAPGAERPRRRFMDPGGRDSLLPGRTPLLLLPFLRISHLTHSLPQERRAGLGRLVGGVGTRIILWINVRLWKLGR